MKLANGIRWTIIGLRSHTCAHTHTLLHYLMHILGRETGGKVSSVFSYGLATQPRLRVHVNKLPGAMECALYDSHGLFETIFGVLVTNYREPRVRTCTCIL